MNHRRIKISKWALIVLSVSALLSSCAEKESAPEPSVSPEPPVMTFEALTETGTSSKTILDADNGAVDWAVGDRVSFLWHLDGRHDSAVSAALTASDIDNGMARLTVGAPDAFQKEDYEGVRSLYAVSPSTASAVYSGNLTVSVPSEQDGTFASANIAVARWDEMNPLNALQFRNLCGLLQINVPSDASMGSAAKIRISAATDIAGRAVVEFADGIPAVRSYADGAKEIVVPVSGKGTYYVAMLPQTASDVKVEILNAGGTVLGNEFKASSLPVKRSVIRRAGEIPVVNTAGSDGDVTDLIRLKPGKLVGIEQLANKNVCNRLIKVGECFDVMLSDVTVFGITDAAREALFSNAAAAIGETGAEIWGMHLPYKDDVDIDSKTASIRNTAVSNQAELMELSIKYLNPKHFVIHPSNTSVYTDQSDFEVLKQNSQECLVKIQAKLDELNDKYGTDAVLCVENCARSVAYDAVSMLELLSAPGLENTRICLDTGHALVPLNGEYVNSDRSLRKAGDVVAMLKQMGTRLGTLHIQQNTADRPSGSDIYDIHIEPFAGGLIDWGEFYRVLLEDCGYRGCFLYEVNDVTYGGESSTIETVAANYQNILYPEYLNN